MQSHARHKHGVGSLGRRNMPLVLFGHRVAFAAVASMILALTYCDLSAAPLRTPLDVLTPATPSTFLVHAGDVFVPGESFLDTKKDDKLMKLADGAGFSTAARLRAQVLAALRSAGWDAAQLDMVRLAVYGKQRVEDYPRATHGHQMLDIRVQGIGLVTRWGRLSSYRPVVSVSYRV
jgi:hypothetical protein